MSDLLKLAERCEAATGPDRDLDYAIQTKALGKAPNLYGFQLDPFTRSIDAAMTLLPGSDWEWTLEWETGSLLYHPDAEMFARAEIGDPRLRMEAEALTLPLALCAAALKARAYVARSEAAAVGGR